MKISRHIGALCACIFTLVGITSAQATLIGVLPATLNGTDYQAYYDPVANLTWLANLDAGAGSSYDTADGYNDGKMTWANANAWAASLDINGVTGWYLPDTVQPDPTCGSTDIYGQNYGYNCTGSKLGNLYYNVLGNPVQNPTNFPFSSNFGDSWTSTAYAPDNESAWVFSFNSGFLQTDNKTDQHTALAVQSGNVGSASIVPVPAAVWLFGSGLIGLVGIARRKKA